MMEIKVLVLNNICYKQSITIQEKLQKNVIYNKNSAYLLFVDYKDHIFTQGKYGKNENILVDTNKLTNLGINLYKTDRGGDVTYHGPGQIVCYPILNLKIMKLTVKKYVFLLEQLIMDYLKDLNIKSARIDGKPGIWVDDCKIASIGVNIKKFVTKHGFSINVNNETKYNNYINPCGYSDLIFTSVKDLIDTEISYEHSCNSLIKHFENLFGFKISGEFFNLNEDRFEKIA